MLGVYINNKGSIYKNVLLREHLKIKIKIRLKIKVL